MCVSPSNALTLSRPSTCSPNRSGSMTNYHLGPTGICAGSPRCVPGYAETQSAYHNCRYRWVRTAAGTRLPRHRHHYREETVERFLRNRFRGNAQEPRPRPVGRRRDQYPCVCPHYCVDAYQRDYEVVVATECIASYDEAHHDITKHYLEGGIARLLPNREIIKMLAS